MIQKYRDLVDKLQNATEERKITWEKTSSENGYFAEIGVNSVTVNYIPGHSLAILGGEISERVSLALRNKDGDVIDEVKAETNNYDFHSLYKLYESARRSCLKVEETIDEMLANLDKK